MMSEPDKKWYQLKVVANGDTHYSEPESLDEEEHKGLVGILKMVTNTGRDESGHLSFEAEGVGGTTFIPSRNIEYVFLREVPDPEKARRERQEILAALDAGHKKSRKKPLSEWLGGWR